MDFNDIVNNVVRVSAIDKDGLTLHSFLTRNTLTYAAGGVLINAVLRSGPSQVSWLYARFGNNTGSPASGALVLPTGGIKAVTRTQFVQSLSNDQGALWVPVLGAVAVSTSNSALYSGNVATFSFRIPSNINQSLPSQTSPVGKFNPDSSYIMALGLAVAVNLSDRTQDVIITALNAITPQLIPSGGQLGIDYPFQITP
jgi:hypothetical protein